MIDSKTNNPEHGEFIQDSKEIFQGVILWASEADDFEDCSEKKCSIEDKDHQNTIAFVWISSHLVEEEEEIENIG